MTRRPSVIIAGAGIVGATLAYHLATGGASVTIIERSRPALGVTARSFAWINVVRGNAPAIARLRNLAIADYRRLERELNGALAIDWNGVLTWSGNPAESERLVAEHTARGHDVRLVERDEIRPLEPRLAATRVRFGLGIERDMHFRPRFAMSVYAEAVHATGSIVERGPELDAVANELKDAAVNRSDTR